VLGTSTCTAVDHTPFAGQTLRTRPALTLAHGDVVWDGQGFHPRGGRDRFLACGAPTLLQAKADV